MAQQNYWQHKTLEQMTELEWERLCDGCGKCCLNKVIDDETDELFFTNVACSQLNTKSGQCKNYANRFKLVPDCFKVTLANRDSFGWLPASCAYRLLDEGKELPSWHPLIVGSAKEMHRLGQSVRGKVIDEKQAGDLEDHVVYWPLQFEP
ncbi:YcgN family cysteine cluster protein [Psychrobium sp. 1_MG-2023]|uniref:YcgN family cysteine cluster protein n=1 Tax=Psychrobium sp. 1_MG-2023 TaxID=3062624 RepID=UPI000C324D1F|nr:YcgN family cysteine cluster protein [Psychrobium sp. 1_MG-2023]MDP2562201.1 YcgN family cysteine cluster protein [Psychrobium sp. 1_MG-2023]PKF58096.1 YcgN family cysteine cluster protein [Alteromonadales bacterium alter-6D02]